MTTETKASFLQSCIESKKEVKVFLRNGIALAGTIQEYDADSLRVVGSGKDNLVMWDAVSTVCVVLPKESNASA
jgi:RNA chaperone Hfq